MSEVVARPAVRPWLRRIARPALVVLIPWALWSAWDYLEARRFRAVVEDIQQRGEPIFAERTANTNATPNAGRYYMAAASLLDRRPLGTSTGIYSAFRFQREGR